MDKVKGLSAGAKFKCPKCSTILFVPPPSTESPTHDVVLQINNHGMLLGIKGRLETSLIVSVDSLAGKKVYDVMPLDLAQPIMECVEKTLQTGDLQRFEYHHLLGDKHYKLKCIANGHDTALTIITNISDYNRAAQKVN